MVIFVLAVATGFAVLAGIWPLHVYLHPIFANGNETALRIDSQIGDMLAARVPALDVGHAACPMILDLTNHRLDRCTIPVSGAVLPVVVTVHAGEKPGLFVDEALVVTANAERRLVESLDATYGEHFTARCPGPAVRVFPRPEAFSCSVEAPDLARTNIDVTSGGLDSAVYPASLAHISTRETRMLGQDTAERREGGVVLDGSTLARYLREKAASDADGAVGRRGLVGPARCPRRVVLNARARARCTVVIGNRTESYDARFDEGRGFVVEGEHTVVVIAAVREIATRYFEREAQSGGKPLRAVVDCGRNSVALLEPGATLPCTIEAGGQKRAFSARVTDDAGALAVDQADD